MPFASDMRLPTRTGGRSCIKNEDILMIKTYENFETADFDVGYKKLSSDAIVGV